MSTPEAPTENIVWDGISNSYIPSEKLNIPPEVELHTETTPEIDPVTYELVRYSLWNINEEHGDTIVRVSGSPIAVFAHDFNPSILTEDGDFVYFGPYLQFHAGMIDVNVKWTLENRGDNPGIEDGDMFMANDPWVGTTHQQDTALLCPVFYDGKIFCWVANMLHLADVGGSTPGSFCPDAEDVYQEPIPTPPLKLVEGGAVRRDVEEQFIRRSRMPDIVRLDLRAVIAGNNVAKRRVLGLLDRYGPDVVKGVMRRIIDDGEQRFLDRLRKCHDGAWSSVNYLEVAKTGDRRTYKSVVTMTKEGDKLVFRNEGTDEQTGAINITYAAFRGGALCSINAFLLHDALYAVGGAVKHIEFELTPGTFTCATPPAACSNGGQIGVHLIMGQAQNTVARMMMTSPEMKNRFVAQGGCSQWPGVTTSGIDQRGNEFGGFMLDPMGGSIGAFAFRDGVDTGGLWFDSKGFMPNVEHNEHTMPVLYLYRKEVPDSGGAGQYRGGNAAQWAFVPHKTDRLVQAASACGCAVPTAHGIAGGDPGAPNEYTFVKGSNVQELFGEGQLPSDVEELTGDHEPLPPKTVDVEQTPHDAYAIRWAAGAGYGDPLTRDPELVARDVREENVTRETAHEIYGVVLDESLRVDDEGTEERRGDLLQERRSEAKPYDFDD